MDAYEGEPPSAFATNITLERTDAIAAANEVADFSPRYRLRPSPLPKGMPRPTVRISAPHLSRGNVLVAMSIGISSI